MFSKKDTLDQEDKPKQDNNDIQNEKSLKKKEEEGFGHLVF